MVKLSLGASQKVQRDENKLEDPEGTVFYVKHHKGITATFSVKTFKILRLKQSLGTK